MRKLVIELFLDELKTGGRQEAAAVLRNIASEVVDSPGDWLYLPHAFFDGRTKLASVKLIDPSDTHVSNLRRADDPQNDT
jgi:hypothetical protein